MPNLDSLRNFVFKGMLLEENITPFQEDFTLQGEKTSESQTDLSYFPSRIRADAMKMMQIYTLFFCFENSVRELVSGGLSEKHGLKWWEEKVPTNIKKKVEQRKIEERKNRWHSSRGQTEINYCDFGDLTAILITNWKDFEDFFPDQEWIKTRLGNLETSRNTIAHNGVLSEEDIQRIKIFVQDWIKQVG